MLRTTLSWSASRVIQRRAIHSSMVNQAATIFGMPAMSPTMDQGGIVKWHFKEGDSFSSGDSLLEVETDKATIDVEAQDDGILAKILIQEGVKDIPVGKPIAITAEPGDDLATLEMPKIEEKEPAEKKTSTTPAPPPAATKKEESSAKPASSQPPKTSGASLTRKANPTQKFFPSVEILLHENGISREDALAKIESSTPKGQITKGDVLAYLGKISKDAVISITSYIDSHSHLDLSNIQLKKPEEAKPLDSKDPTSSVSPDKPAKPAPVKISKTFILSQPISESQLTQIVAQATKLSEQYSYASPLYGSSDLIDPIFEELVAPASNTERFKVNVKINEPVLAQQQEPQLDIFDYLTGTKLGSGAAAASLPTALPSVDVDLIINEKVVDAKQRAELFISRFGQLLTVPQEPKKVEEFEF